MRTLSPIAVLFLLAMLVAQPGCDNGKNGTPTGPSAMPKAAETTLERVHKAGILRIAIRSESAPFSFKDEAGNPRGFEVDMGFALAKHLGVRPDFVFVTAKERLEKLKAGEVDCIMATLTATRRRYKEVDFSIPYFEDQQRLLVKKDSPIQSYRDLSGKKVAALESTTNFDNLTTVKPDCQPVGVKNMDEALKQLDDGQVDAVTWDGVKLISLAEKNPAYRIAGEGFSIEPYCVGLPQNDSEFRRTVDDFLMTFWVKGDWTKAFSKWLGANPQIKPTFQMPILPD